AVKALSSKGEISVLVDFRDIQRFDPKLANGLLKEPDRFLEAGSRAIKLTIQPLDEDYASSVPTFHFRVHNLPESVALRKIRAHHISKLIQIEAIMTRASEVKPRLINGVFECQQCGSKTIVHQLEGRFTQPPVCSNPDCKRKGPFKFIEQESEFRDWQHIGFQERPEELPAGQLPRTFNAVLEEDLVDTARPGDLIVLAGILRSTPQTGLRARTAIFKTYLDVVSILAGESEASRITISTEDEKRILDAGKDPFIDQRVLASIAPSIYGHEVIKQAVAFLLFGGVRKELADQTIIRGDINVLLVGDPGTGKSVHGSEPIYVAKKSKNNAKWNIVPIGSFVDQLINSHRKQVIVNGESEILRLPRNLCFLTMSMNPSTLKTQKSRILEVSRHKTDTLFKVVTRSGRQVLVTPDHSFSTLSNGKLIVLTAKDLRRGVYLPVARRIDFGKNKEITRNAFENLSVCLMQSTQTRMLPESYCLDEKLGRVVGFYLSGVDIENVDVRFAILEQKDNCSHNFTPHKPVGASLPYNGDQYPFPIHLSKWLKHTFGSKASERILPHSVYTSPYAFRKGLLSAYFSSNATINQDGTIIAIAKNRKIACNITNLLATFDIYSHIVDPIHTIQCHEKTYHQLVITGHEATKFTSKIGFITELKNHAGASQINRVDTKQRLYSHDVIPDSSKVYYDVVQVLNQGQNSKHSLFLSPKLYAEFHGQQISRLSLHKFFSQLGQTSFDNELGKKIVCLKKLATSDIFWDEIIDIKIINKSTMVYDIGTADEHFIIANGNLIVHNSQILKFGQRLAPRAIYTSGKGTSAAGLCVAPDTLIIGDCTFTPIKEIVKEKQKEGKKEVDTGTYRTTSKHPIRIQTINSVNISTRNASNFWQLKAPRKLIRIISETGREIILTPETKLMTIEDARLTWKKSRHYKAGEYIAVARRLEHKGENRDILELLAEKTNNIWVHDVQDFVNDIVKRIRLKTPLGKANPALRNRNNESIPLKTLITLGKLAGITLDQLKDHTKTLSYGKKNRIRIPRAITRDLMYFAGLIAGDGDVLKDPGKEKKIVFRGFSQEIRAEYAKVVKQLFGIVATPACSKQETYLEFSSNIVARILNKIGISLMPGRTDLNDLALSLPDEVLAGFISGLFDSSGRINLEKAEIPYLEIRTPSKNLAKKLQLVLLRFSIISFLENKTETKISDNKNHVPPSIYQLKIIGPNIIRFNEYISTKNATKKTQIQKLLSEKTSHKMDLDIIPNVTRILKMISRYYNIQVECISSGRNPTKRELEKILARIKKLRKNDPSLPIFESIKDKICAYPSGLSTAELEKKIGANHHQHHNYLYANKKSDVIPLSILEQISKDFPQNKKSYYKGFEIIEKLNSKRSLIRQYLSFLHKIIRSDIYWDEIKSIELIGSNSTPYVYDLTVEDSHSFLANGILVHNTAAVLKDPDTGGMTLEAGALVLADKGVAMIDELDKMSREDRGAAHEAMEQQTISIAKAGIVATLNARAAILAAANPAFGRYNDRRTAEENLNLPSTLLSRFDLIFVMRDIPDEQKDREMSRFILNLHSPDSAAVEPPFDMDFLRKYIYYAKENVRPKLTEKAIEKLQDYFIEMRARYNAPGSAVAITARQLEALVRLSEARARMCLREEVTETDADAAIRLMDESLRQVATNPETGQVDINMITVGKTSTQLNRMQLIDELMIQLTAEHPNGIPHDVLVEAAVKEGLEEQWVVQTLEKLKADGRIYEPRPDRYLRTS
ncbi:MAG: LAGLIDADG family homing endonuclease, partial [Candidatus Ranarchaeia archaeon]